MKKIKKLFFLFILVLAALSCNLPSGTSTPADDQSENETPSTLPQTENPGQNPTETQSAATLTETLLPSETPSITPTATPSIPMVSVSANTNCRKGPGVVYDLLTALLVGEEAEIVGKYTVTDPDYWIIEKDSVTCWLWGEYATVEGDISKLPEMIPPPTPTPSPTPTATPTPTETPTP